MTKDGTTDAQPEDNADKFMALLLEQSIQQTRYAQVTARNTKAILWMLAGFALLTAGAIIAVIGASSGGNSEVAALVVGGILAVICWLVAWEEASKAYKLEKVDREQRQGVHPFDRRKDE